MKYNTEMFIEKAKTIHKDKYDYSKVEYFNSVTKVCIICPIHGEFWQIPQDHLQGHGCPNCYKEKRENKNKFIKRFQDVHGNKYDYSKFEFLGKNIKSCFICHEKDKNGNEHGEFWQLPSQHVFGRGCPKCGKNKCNTEEFIMKAKKIHGNKYDYSQVRYVNKTTKVCIIDKEYGEFWQTPESHLRGHNNPKQYRYDKEKFIKKAKEIHGDKYDYSKLEYTDMTKKVCIICPIHGEFWQKAYDHLHGHGCHKCGKTCKLNTEEFIAKAKKVHDDKYDYSKVEYVNNQIKICIICPIHGEFWQLPMSHLNGNGCPECGYKKQNCELQLCDWLKKENIKFERHAKFKWLGRQNLDVYLPEYNIGIEYQGKQHFTPIKFYGGEEGFNKTVERDKRKFKLCQENNLELLYVSFEKELPETYLGEIYNNENELIKKIKENVNN